MTWTLTRRLILAGSLAGLVVLVSAGYCVVTLRALVDHTETLDVMADRDALQHKMLAAQIDAVALFRLHALEPKEEHSAEFLDITTKIDKMAQDLMTMEAQDPTASHFLEAWMGVFEDWQKNVAKPFIQGRTKGRPNLDFSVKDQLLPRFMALDDYGGARQDTSVAEVHRISRQAIAAGWLGGLASLGLGGLLITSALRKIKRDLNGAAGTTSAAATEIAATVSQQERTVVEQASAVNELTATMNELSTTATQAAEHGEAISFKSNEAMASASRWGDTVHAHMEQMQHLKDRMESISAQILELSGHNAQIGSILSSVSEIASQTNLLALNAAVEAARAGEHGRGFAVVASEIRKLADQSKKALERVAQLVGEIQRTTNTTVMAVEEGGKLVDGTTRQAAQTGQAIESILGALQETVQNTQQIALNLRQQTLGVRQVNEALASLNNGMKETSTGIGQIKQGLFQLEGMGRNIQNLV